MIGVIRKIKGKRKYFIDGKEVTEAVFNKKMDCVVVAPPPKRKGLKRGYPIKSIALAVHSTQVKEAQEDAVKKGVPTEFTKDGRPILRDASHRKNYLKAYGFHDRNSFNGY